MWGFNEGFNKWLSELPQLGNPLNDNLRVLGQTKLQQGLAWRRCCTHSNINKVGSRCCILRLPDCGHNELRASWSYLLNSYKSSS